MSDNRCQWCGEPATATREVEPDVVDRKTGKLKRKGIRVDVCAAHAAVIDRSVEARELHAQRRRLRGRIMGGRGNVDQARGEIKRVERRLVELGELRDAG